MATEESNPLVRPASTTKSDLQDQLKLALGAFGECAYNLEIWTARQAEARRTITDIQAQLSKGEG